jgi:hypothetical protein
VELLNALESFFETFFCVESMCRDLELFSKKFQINEKP